MEADKPKKDKDKVTNQNKTPLVCQSINSKGCPITYCYTHGITKNIRHNIMIYKRTCEGYKKEAILQIKMGGVLETVKSAIVSLGII